MGNDEGRGHNDYCLSELGFKQAELLGERLKDYEFDAVFSSPLLRCVCTAACAVSKMKERPTIELLPEIIEKGTSVGYVCLIYTSSRRHIETISQTVEHTLADSGLSRGDIDAVAVTAAPGLIGALLTGVSFAKAASFALGVPLIPVHHIRGHIAANYIAFPELVPPFVLSLIHI